jgi:hypothetical protein
METELLQEEMRNEWFYLFSDFQILSRKTGPMKAQLC